jgi:hypothetical protein
MAVDTWGGNTTMTFLLITGTRPNQNPIIEKSIKAQTAYRNQLFYYRIPSDAFSDPDGDPLFYLVSDKDGNYLPNWLIYEEAGQIISGIARSTDSSTTVLIVADDQNGGSVS